MFVTLSRWVGLMALLLGCGSPAQIAYVESRGSPTGVMLDRLPWAPRQLPCEIKPGDTVETDDQTTVWLRFSEQRIATPCRSDFGTTVDEGEARAEAPAVATLQRGQRADPAPSGASGRGLWPIRESTFHRAPVNATGPQVEIADGIPTAILLPGGLASVGSVGLLAGEMWLSRFPLSSTDMEAARFGGGPAANTRYRIEQADALYRVAHLGAEYEVFVYAGRVKIVDLTTNTSVPVVAGQLLLTPNRLQAVDEARKQAIEREMQALHLIEASLPPLPPYEAQAYVAPVEAGPADPAPAAAVQLSDLAGRWTAKWKGQTIRREITGDTEQVWYYEKGKRVYGHEAKIRLVTTSNGRTTLRWTGLNRVTGPKARASARSGRYLIDFRGDCMIETHPRRTKSKAKAKAKAKGGKKSKAKATSTPGARVVWRREGKTDARCR